MRHMTKKHRNELTPAGKSLCSSLRLMLGYEISKFCSWKMMKQLTKQACYLYHESALLEIVMRNFLAKKYYTTFCPEGFLFNSYFGQE
jgi:hypothetical protein